MVLTMDSFIICIKSSLTLNLGPKMFCPQSWRKYFRVNFEFAAFCYPWTLSFSRAIRHERYNYSVYLLHHSSDTNLHRSLFCLFPFFPCWNSSLLNLFFRLEFSRSINIWKSECEEENSGENKNSIPPFLKIPIRLWKRWIKRNDWKCAQFWKKKFS